MNLGLDCPCLINVGGRGVSGTDRLISPVYSSPKEDSGWVGGWVRANLNQESSYLDVALFSLQNQGLLKFKEGFPKNNRIPSQKTKR